MIFNNYKKLNGRKQATKGLAGIKMGAINRLEFYLENPRQIYLLFTVRGLFNWMPDSWYLRMIFRLCIGKKLNLKKPQTFNEKLQWLKIHDRNSSYTKMVDKYEAKRYIADIIGEEYVIPLLGVWNSFDDIDFTSLPDSFVLKCTHDSGGLVIVEDKSKMDVDEARKKIDGSMSRNYYWMSREWPYKDVKPRIIAEQFMVDDSGTELKDYKFFCFHGEPKYCQVISNRRSDETIDFFDMEWIHQEFTGLGFPYKQQPHSSDVIPTPINFVFMKKVAKSLSEGIPFVRVDFYEVNGHMYVGELTFYPFGGLGVFSPENWNLKIGNLVEINTKEVK